MPSIINASSSGSGGIVQTADASGVLQLQTNGTVALSIDTSANITFADGSKNLTLQQTTAAGANSTSYPGYIAFTGFGWNTSLGSSPLGIRLAAGGNYTPDLGQVAPGLSISTQNTNGSMTQRMLLNGYGIGLGTGTYPISGTGVKFPATQDPSSDANTLDDYEEGTFTPTAFGATTAGTTTYASRDGGYTKIGNQVTVWGYLDVSGMTGTGDLLVGGLPFLQNSSGTRIPATSFFVQNLDWGAGLTTPVLIGTASQAHFRAFAVGDNTAWSTIPVDGVFTMHYSLTYFV
jgi:hypothetical protein